MKSLLLIAAMIFSAHTWAADEQEPQKLLNELATILNQKAPNETSFYFERVVCFPAPVTHCSIGNPYTPHPNAFSLDGAEAQRMIYLLQALGFKMELTIPGEEKYGQSIVIDLLRCETDGGNYSCAYQQPLKLKSN